MMNSFRPTQFVLNMPVVI